MTINNHQLDRAEFEKSILLHYEYDGLDNYRKEYNDMLIDKAALSNCIVQDKYFTVTVSKKSIDDARAFFNRVGNDLTARLSRIDSKCRPLMQRKDCVFSTIFTVLEMNKTTTLTLNCSKIKAVILGTISALINGL